MEVLRKFAHRRTGDTHVFPIARPPCYTNGIFGSFTRPPFGLVIAPILQGKLRILACQGHVRTSDMPCHCLPQKENRSYHFLC